MHWSNQGSADSVHFVTRTKPHAVVIGAGYAGAMASKRLLMRNTELRVTVVNPREQFVERIRLHQLAAGTADAVAPLADVLHPRTELKVGSVERIDAARRLMHLADGGALPYDFAVYAVGSRCGTPPIPGAAQHAYPIAEYEEAQRLRERLEALPRPSAVAVIGGGLTGIETAAELSEQYPDVDVTLISDSDIAETLTETARKKISATLTSLGVTMVVGSAVAEVQESKVVLADGSCVGSDCTVLATSFEVPDLASRSGLPVDERGRLRVDSALRCEGNPTIVGAGDAIAVAGIPLRMSCQAAMPLGAHAADTIRATIAGKDPKPVSPNFFGQCVGLGRRSALFQPTDSLDRPRAFSIGGRTTALIKEQVCSSTLHWMLNPKRPLAYTWS